MPNSINQKIYVLEKRLLTSISVKERMAIISGIRSLKNAKKED